jgi:hypothetical protein
MTDDTNLKGRDGRGRYTRSLESAERDAEAARLHAQGWTYKAIAAELQMGDKSTAIRAVQRAVRAVVQGPATEVLKLHTSRLEWAYGKAVEIAEANHTLVSQGKVIRGDDGNPLRDHAPVLAALREARQTLESFRNMMGLNQPVKVDATVHQVTQQDLELQEMLREAKARTELEERRSSTARPRPDPVTTAVRTPGTYLEGLDAETFNLDAYLAQFDPRLLADPEGRRTLTRLDPLLFALVYLRHHLKDEDGRITFGDAHLDWCRAGRRWVRPPTGPAQERDAWIAPRNTGKTTWWFLILPMWAAAHGHVRFAAAFASAATQAERHLSTFKRELDSNALLRRDFPDLCTAAKRPGGQNVADTQSMYVAKSGFIFAAHGIDSSALGMKVEEKRPDLLLCDDIEPDEASYSAALAAKRKTTLLDAILPLNIYARVAICGTVTMPGSIIHQLVKAAKGVHVAQWIRMRASARTTACPSWSGPDGTERSMWPAKWPIGYLLEIRHTRSYAKNMANDPLAADGALWTPDDFRYPEPPTPCDSPTALNRYRRPRRPGHRRSTRSRT